MVKLNQVIFLTLILAFLTSCATSPLGRSQLLMQDEKSLMKTSEKSFADMKREIPITKDKKLTQYVQCVVSALGQEVVGDWEVVVFEDPQVNAFALPGGKIGVYTGILQVANNQDQLAAIIGHEMSHVLAHHANERVSAGTLANIGLVVLGLASNRDQGMQLAVAALGLGVQYGILMPYSRSHETEADLLGLDIMAKAGFNPEEAPKLWEKMKQNKKEKDKVPEWMSTHPSDDTRIQQLQDRTQEAKWLMKTAHQQHKKPNCASE
jgi:predicted Zn-dependent protease